MNKTPFLYDNKYMNEIEIKYEQIFETAQNLQDLVMDLGALMSKHASEVNEENTTKGVSL